MNDFDERYAFIIDRLAPLHRALAEVAAVLDRGRLKHPEGDGFRRPISFQIERARLHLQALERGDTAEQHLEHAVTRLLMGLESVRESEVRESESEGGDATEVADDPPAEYFKRVITSMIPACNVNAIYLQPDGELTILPVLFWAAVNSPPCDNAVVGMVLTSDCLQFADYVVIPGAEFAGYAPGTRDEVLAAWKKEISDLRSDDPHPPRKTPDGATPPRRIIPIAKAKSHRPRDPKDGRPIHR